MNRLGPITKRELEELSSLIPPVPQQFSHLLPTRAPSARVQTNYSSSINSASSKRPRITVESLLNFPAENNPASTIEPNVISDTTESTKEITSETAKSSGKSPQLTQTEKYQISDKERSVISSFKGGSETLEILQNEMPRFEEFGLTKEDIIKIARHNRAFQTFQTLFNHWSEFEDLDINKDQIVKVAARDYASNLLKTLIDKSSALEKLGFKKDEILKIAYQSGASKTIKTLIEKWSDLRDLGFSKEHIFEICSHDTAASALLRILSNFEILMKKHGDIEGIVKFACTKKALKQEVEQIEVAKTLTNFRAVFNS